MPLVTTKDMFAKAYQGGYAIGAFNINNMETIQGIVEAGAETRSPLILQVSKGARQYANTTYLKKLMEAAVIESPTDRFAPFTVHYAETFILPASIGAYTIRPLENGSSCGTIKAYVRH